MKNVLFFKNFLLICVAVLAMSADGCFNDSPGRNCDFEKMSKDVDNYYTQWINKVYNGYMLSYSDCTNFKKEYDKMIKALVACPQVDAASKSALNDLNSYVQSWDCNDWVSIKPDKTPDLAQKILGLL